MQEQLMMEAKRVLRMLADDKSVLLTGAPATGKTTLLNMAEHLFLERGETTVDPYGAAAFPIASASDEGAFPGGGCSNRKVFRTTFHQGTRYRVLFAASSPSQTRARSSLRSPKDCFGRHQSLQSSLTLLRFSSLMRSIVAQPSAFSGI